MDKYRSLMENLCERVAGGKGEAALDENYPRVLNLYACEGFTARDNGAPLCVNCRSFASTGLSQNMGFGWCKK